MKSLVDFINESQQIRESAKDIVNAILEPVVYGADLDDEAGYKSFVKDLEKLVNDFIEVNEITAVKQIGFSSSWEDFIDAYKGTLGKVNKLSDSKADKEIFDVVDANADDSVGLEDATTWQLVGDNLLFIATPGAYNGDPFNGKFYKV